VAAIVSLIFVSVSVAPVHADFEPRQDFTASGRPVSVAAADFNADGKLDLATANNFDGTVSVLLGNGNGTFQAEQVIPMEASAFTLHVTVGDVNGDGKADLAVANPGRNEVVVLLGNGNGTFQVKPGLGVGLTPFSVTVADLNGDTKPDLVAANYGDNTVSVRLGNGNGTFQDQQTFATGASPKIVVVADFNGDSKPDLAVSNSGASTVGVLLGNGNGTFQAMQGFATGSGPVGVAAPDLNGDGKLDLVTANGLAGSVSVLLGNGNGTFQPRKDVPAGSGASGLAVADVNTDGRLDVVTANFSDNTVSVFLGDGTGTLVQQSFATAGGPQFVAVADLNGDTRPDLAAAGSNDNKVSVLLGISNGVLQFSSPTASVTEGGTSTLTLTRTGSTTGAVSVSVSVAGGTATQGQDFTYPAPQTVTWGHGDGTPKTVSIPTIQDSTAESDETAQFVLTLPLTTTWPALGPQATTTLTVVDDDANVPGTPCSPRPRVVQSVASGGGALTVVINASPQNDGVANTIQRIVFGTLQNATVTLNGQAVADGQTVTLPAGATSASLVVQRVTPGAATTVPFTVVDGCGEWKTFVGGGTNAGF
jgi:hypothetical protein